MIVTIHDNQAICYKDWAFEIDQKLTETLYSNVMWGKADAIPKTEFRVYSALRENLFPADILCLFKQLGINYKKESILNHFICENEQHCFEGCFHFIGKMTKGNYCLLEMENGEKVFELTPINDSFSIGFYSDNTCIASKPMLCISFSITISSSIYNNTAFNL